MIQSRPKISTLFSIGIFLLISYAVFIYVFLEILQSNTYNTWSFILMFTSGPIAIVVTLKTFLGIKLIKISKERFTFKYPFQFSRKKFVGKEIVSWELNKIKTYGGTYYEELIWHIKTGKKYAISKQEHTEFKKILNYMNKKFKKIKK